MVIQSDPIDIGLSSNSLNSANSSSSASSSFPGGSVNSVRPPILKEFQLNGWEFKSIRSSISSANQIETLSHELGFPLPTMFFGCNRISVSNPSKDFSLEFNPIEAVKNVSKSADSVPIRIAASHADFWRQKSQSEIVFDYDWTYTPQSYKGNFTSKACEIVPTELEIDFNRLKQQDPILFFDENILYEDELGDNGISIISVKLRVMEYGFYILYSHFLRVDQIIFKTAAARFYHEFSQNFILRECRTSEDSFENISEKMILAGSNFKDNEAVQQFLPITSKRTDKIIL